MVLLLSACSSMPSLPLISSSDSLQRDMYLRGVFSWWEADDTYKLIKGSDGQYRASFELVADGQPYDFKISDAQWSQGFHCGYIGSDQDSVVSLGREIQADCNAKDVKNFKFTPPQTGNYQFMVDFSNLQNPTLIVSKL